MPFHLVTFSRTTFSGVWEELGGQPSGPCRLLAELQGDWEAAREESEGGSGTCSGSCSGGQCSLRRGKGREEREEGEEENEQVLSHRIQAAQDQARVSMIRGGQHQLRTAWTHNHNRKKSVVDALCSKSVFCISLPNKREIINIDSASDSSPFWHYNC